MSVSSFAMFCICVALIASIAVPVAMLIMIPKKTGGSKKAFWIGCLVMFLFSLTLESLFHQFVNGTEVGKVIWNTPILYALYGGLMAGLFEETGRLLAFRTVLKKDLDNDGNSFTYAAGHAGFEMFAILFFTMLNNLTYALVMKYPDKMEQVYQHATPQQAEQIKAIYEQLAVTPGWTYLLSIAERGSAIILQFGFTIFVWFAAKKGGKKFFFYPIAILLHLLADSGIVLIYESTKNAFVTELCIFAFAIVVAVLAWNVWKKERSKAGA